jgi:hypothetical protein
MKRKYNLSAISIRHSFVKMKVSNFHTLRRNNFGGWTHVCVFAVSLCRLVTVCSLRGLCCHCVLDRGKILSSPPDICRPVWPNYLKSSRMPENFFPPPYHFSIDINQFSHSVDGDSTLLRNVEICDNCTVQKPNKRR